LTHVLLQQVSRSRYCLRAWGTPARRGAARRHNRSHWRVEADCDSRACRHAPLECRHPHPNLLAACPASRRR
jgi:hypothetical protein